MLTTTVAERQAAAGMATVPTTAKAERQATAGSATIAGVAPMPTTIMAVSHRQNNSCPTTRPNRRCLGYTGQMTIMALDIGKVRTGIAISDPSERIAHPICVLSSTEIAAGSKSFSRLLSDYQIDSLLVGLPVSLDGQEHSQAAWVRDVADALSQRYQLPVRYLDERLTSRQAGQMMQGSGLSQRQQRGKLDMVAASLILQNYLDKCHQEKR